MSFHISVDFKGKVVRFATEAVVMGHDEAKKVKKIIDATCKAAGLPVTSVITPSVRHATHSNAWAASKSIINRL